MLNKQGTRELAYVVEINDIQPIEGSDNCECAVVGGWRIMVRKNTFKPGDLAIYFEIDSQVDILKPEFAFLASKHGKIKTQKYTFGGKGNFISQGLLMSPEDFGWITDDADGSIIIVPEPYGATRILNAGDFLTQELGVTYADPDDKKRKANSNDKYKLMAARHQNLFKRKPFRWLMRRTWGRKLLFLFFGKKRDKKNGWPAWVKKTDEERIENCTFWLNDNDAKWIATEKIDGTSTTFAMKRKLFGYDFYICSRNVVFDKPDKKCFYDTNVYTEMAVKYNIENILKDILKKHKEYKWIYLQGETFGSGIQKRDYSAKEGEHKFNGFNFVTSTEGRWNSEKAQNFFFEYNIPWVPILDIEYHLPSTVEELRNYVNSKPSMIDGKIKEGIVFRSQDGTQSFKCVSPEFLLEYHN